MGSRNFRNQSTIERGGMKNWSDIKTRRNDRWSQWAHDLLSRYDRTAHRNVLLEMKLVRHLCSVSVYSPAWNRMVYSLFSRIQFSMLRILNQTSISRRNMAAVSGEKSSHLISLLGGKIRNLGFSKYYSQSSQEYIVSNTVLSFLHFPFSSAQERFPDRVPSSMERMLASSRFSLVDQVFFKFRRTEIYGGQTMVQQKSRSIAAAEKVTQRSINIESVNRHQEEISNLGKQLSAPAIDIERLTDQVVQRIDHRITAHCERLGRVF